jgi:hypothetical protein
MANSIHSIKLHTIMQTVISMTGTTNGRLRTVDLPGCLISTRVIHMYVNISRTGFVTLLLSMDLMESE